MIPLVTACLLFFVNSPSTQAFTNIANCGIANNGYIVGGEEVEPHTHPWMVGMIYRGSFRCGGSLIQNSAGVMAVLTAAHCIPSNQNQLAADFGEHDRTVNEGSEQTIQVTEVTVHSGYNPNTFQNDIAIMKLASAPTLNQYVQPICVSNTTKPVGMNTTVIGWGVVTEGGSTLPAKLRKVNKPILTDDACRNQLGSNNYYNTNMLCAGFDAGGADACQGDSGGPLMYMRDGRMEVIGIVSWGYGCARPLLPGVYADVQKLEGWITTAMN